MDLDFSLCGNTMEFPISGALDIIYQITIMQRKQGSVDSIFRPSNNEFLRISIVLVN